MANFSFGHYKKSRSTWLFPYLFLFLPTSILDSYLGSVYQRSVEKQKMEPNVGKGYENLEELLKETKEREEEKKKAKYVEKYVKEDTESNSEKSKSNSEETTSVSRSPKKKKKKILDDTAREMSESDKYSCKTAKMKTENDAEHAGTNSEFNAKLQFCCCRMTKKNILFLIGAIHLFLALLFIAITIAISKWQIHGLKTATVTPIVTVSVSTATTASSAEANEFFMEAYYFTETISMFFGFLTITFFMLSSVYHENRIVIILAMTISILAFLGYLFVLAVIIGYLITIHVYKDQISSEATREKVYWMLPTINLVYVVIILSWTAISIVALGKILRKKKYAKVEVAKKKSNKVEVAKKKSTR